METKKLFRYLKQGMIGGVSVGLGKHLAVDSTMVRLIFVLLFMVGMSGVLVYLIMWLLIPVELKMSQERLHILDAYLIALENLDEVIDTIRRSQRVETARNNLMRKYNLDEIQTQAILDMPLRRLAALERKKIEEEHKEVTKRIKELKKLLHSPKQMRCVVIDELKSVREQYADPRRSQIIQKVFCRRKSNCIVKSSSTGNPSANGRISRGFLDPLVLSDGFMAHVRCVLIFLGCSSLGFGNWDLVFQETPGLPSFD